MQPQTYPHITTQKHTFKRRRTHIGTHTLIPTHRYKQSLFLSLFSLSPPPPPPLLFFRFLLPASSSFSCFLFLFLSPDNQPNETQATATATATTTATATAAAAAQQQPQHNRNNGQEVVLCCVLRVLRVVSNKSSEVYLFNFLSFQGAPV